MDAQRWSARCSKISLHPVTFAYNVKRLLLCVCRLQAAEAKPTVELFQQLWAAQSEEADLSDLEAETSSEITSAAASSMDSAADSRSSVNERFSSPPANPMADGNRAAAESGKLSQQGNDGAADVAADVAGGTSSKGMASKGGVGIALYAA